MCLLKKIYSRFLRVYVHKPLADAVSEKTSGENKERRYELSPSSPETEAKKEKYILERETFQLTSPEASRPFPTQDGSEQSRAVASADPCFRAAACCNAISSTPSPRRMTGESRYAQKSGGRERAAILARFWGRRAHFPVRDTAHRDHRATQVQAEALKKKKEKVTHAEFGERSVTRTARRESYFTQAQNTRRPPPVA